MFEATQLAREFVLGLCGGIGGILLINGQEIQEEQPEPLTGLIGDGALSVGLGRVKECPSIRQGAIAIWMLGQIMFC
jgi:hypothetical protein